MQTGLMGSKKFSRKSYFDHPVYPVNPVKNIFLSKFYIMKLVLFYAHNFYFKTASKSLAEVPDMNIERSVDNTVVVFFSCGETG